MKYAGRPVRSAGFTRQNRKGHQHPIASSPRNNLQLHLREVYPHEVNHQVLLCAYAVPRHPVLRLPQRHPPVREYGHHIRQPSQPIVIHGLDPVQKPAHRAIGPHTHQILIDQHAPVPEFHKARLNGSLLFQFGGNDRPHRHLHAILPQHIVFPLSGGHIRIKPRLPGPKRVSLPIG